MDLKERVREFYRSGKPIVRIEELSSFFDELVEVVVPGERPDMKFHLARDVLTRCSVLPEPGARFDAIREDGFRPLLLKAPLGQEAYMRRGDCCLFMVGMFSDFLQKSRRLPGRSYFVSYGRGCYYLAAQSSGFVEARPVLAKLADDFNAYARAFNQVAEVTFR